MSKGIKKVRYKDKIYYYTRNYKEEYSERTSEQKDNRAIRRMARKKMEKEFGKARLKGKDVDHINGIKAGNGKKNLRVISKKRNRSKH